MKYKFLLLVCLVSGVFNIQAARATEGYCLCLTSCKSYSYDNDAQLVNAKAACKLPACASPYEFFPNKQCQAFSGHCDCKSGCVNKIYTDANGVTAGNAYCASSECSATDKVFKEGACAVSASGGSGKDKKDPGFVQLDNPLNLSTDVKYIIGTVIKGALGVMGALVLLMVVKGGSTWILAAGNPEKVKEGSQTILWALLGAVLTVASYIILSGIMKFF